MGHVKVSRDIVNGKKHFVYNNTVKTVESVESETAYKNLSEDYRTQIDSLINILKPLTLKETEAIYIRCTPFGIIELFKIKKLITIV